ncbi:unnamed protein product [Miscanthus lutarioriparius]|uniref:Phospholipase A1 n=1 Tax=Miscanthus lutarioriparius TaxID=422564 RepID=A0A811RY08_9POAL|nr:unnamed protein product [Miscanthus lutarioriparius]
MASSANGSITTRWRELQGDNSWKGLLDPLDMDLRKSIISYGELAEATYDGFNTERRSPHAGACMYGYSDLLASSGVAAAGHYEVTRFIYATSGQPLPDAFLRRPLAALKDVWSRESNFMGYVAVATDEGAAALGRRDIVVAWRGTVQSLDHAGSKFNKTSARDQVFEEVRRLVELYKDEEMSITITGHSLGAAISILNAVDIVSNGVNVPGGSSSTNKPPCPVTAIVFACPHVGDRFFRAAFQSFKDLKALHVKNAGDVVPMYPPLAYVDVAVTLNINTGAAPEGLLEVERDVALVNKGADALKDEYPVPASWWAPKINKGMVKDDADGQLMLNDFQQI